MNKEFYAALRVLEDSGTTEGNTIAECLRDLSENNDEEDGDVTDEYLYECAKELQGWAQHMVDVLTPTHAHKSA